VKLGDLALARGEPAAARAAWQRIGPAFTVSWAASNAWLTPAGSPLWLAMRNFDLSLRSEELRGLLAAPGPALPGVYPDSDLDPAAVLARLVLASLMENSRERAAIELATLQALYPLAEGTLGGVQGRYVDRLKAILEVPTDWPAAGNRRTGTFGGNSSRGRSLPARLIRRAVAAVLSLPRLSGGGDALGRDGLRPADDARALLSYHPVVVGQTALVKFDAGGDSHVVALDLKTGQRLWPADRGRELSEKALPSDNGGELPAAGGDARAAPARYVGAIRNTLSVTGNKLFACAGTPASDHQAAASPTEDQGVLLGLDIASQGQPLAGFPIHPPSNEWTFAGRPCPTATPYMLGRGAGVGSRNFTLPRTSCQRLPHKRRTTLATMATSAP
jgi:hypothetical protein